jgi:predicted small lipoprotein YifL
MLPVQNLECDVIRIPSLRLAAFATLAVALLLSGCGRKGALEPPPGASIAEPAQAAPASGSLTNMNPLAPSAKPASPQAFGANGQPIAPTGPKKSIFLDWLID